MKRKRVLFVAPECPWPCDSGLRNHSLGMLRALARQAEVTVLGFAGGPAEDRAWEDLAHQEGFRMAGSVRRVTGAELMLRRAAALATGRPLSCAAFGSAFYRSQLHETTARARREGRPFDWIAFEMFWTLSAAPDLPGENILLFPVDGYRLYWRRMAATTPDLVDRWRARYLEAACGRLERHSYRRAGVIATVAPADAASIAEGCPGVRVEVVPVPLIRPLPAPAQRTSRVLVCGDFRTPSIAHDARRFLEQWAASGAGADLVIWGRGAGSAGLPVRAAGASLTEWVDDPGAFLQAASIFVYPQRFACGIQTKVQEAMAAGLCVVAGPEVLDPIGACPGVEAIQARGPEEVVGRLRELLAEPARVASIGRAARRLAASRFSLEAVADRLGQVMNAGRKESFEHEDLLHC